MTIDGKEYIEVPNSDSGDGCNLCAFADKLTCHYMDFYAVSAFGNNCIEHNCYYALVGPKEGSCKKMKPQLEIIAEESQEEKTATWEFDMECPKCGGQMIASDEDGVWCVMYGCGWEAARK